MPPFPFLFLKSIMFIMRPDQQSTGIRMRKRAEYGVVGYISAVIGPFLFISEARS